MAILTVHDVNVLREETFLVPDHSDAHWLNC